MSVWDRANHLRDEESVYARLAVKNIQSGRDDPQWFVERAGALRAERYEFEATGFALGELWTERSAELNRRVSAANRRVRDLHPLT